VTCFLKKIDPEPAEHAGQQLQSIPVFLIENGNAAVDDKITRQQLQILNLFHEILLSPNRGRNLVCVGSILFEFGESIHPMGPAESALSATRTIAYSVCHLDFS
jgi:hypothetical protein